MQPNKRVRWMKHLSPFSSGVDWSAMTEIRLGDKVQVVNNGIQEGWVTLITPRGINVQLSGECAFVKWSNVIKYELIEARKPQENNSIKSKLHKIFS